MSPSHGLTRSYGIRYSAKSIGHIAFNVISNFQEGRVLGKTSRGLFIKSASKWLIFISWELFRSPLTINVREHAGLRERISQDMPISMSDCQVIFPDADLVVSTQNALIWRSLFPMNPPLSVPERTQRLTSTAMEVMNVSHGTGLLFLIPQLLNLPGSDYLIERNLSPFEDDAIQNIATIPFLSYSKLADFLVRFLGVGSGLTPSGDDFVVGFLLALNRWKDVLIPGHRIDEINRAIIASAYQKTTTLSANLIECASQGQADERLIAAIDWLMGGTSPVTDSIENLLGWGSSSGGDVFTGFVAAMTLQSDVN